jgi:hypothetical protein
LIASVRASKSECRKASARSRSCSGGERQRHHQLDEGETVNRSGSHAGDFRERRCLPAIGASA